MAQEVVQGRCLPSGRHFEDPNSSCGELDVESGERVVTESLAVGDLTSKFFRENLSVLGLK